MSSWIGTMTETRPTSPHGCGVGAAAVSMALNTVVGARSGGNISTRAAAERPCDGVPTSEGVKAPHSVRSAVTKRLETSRSASAVADRSAAERLEMSRPFAGAGGSAAMRLEASRSRAVDVSVAETLEERRRPQYGDETYLLPCRSKILLRLCLVVAKLRGQSAAVIAVYPMPWRPESTPDQMNRNCFQMDDWNDLLDSEDSLGPLPAFSMLDGGRNKLELNCCEPSRKDGPDSFRSNARPGSFLLRSAEQGELDERYLDSEQIQRFGNLSCSCNGNNSLVPKGNTGRVTHELSRVRIRMGSGHSGNDAGLLKERMNFENSDTRPPVKTGRGHANTLSSQERRQLRKENRCFACMVVGHESRHCLKSEKALQYSQLAELSRVRNRVASTHHSSGRLNFEGASSSCGIPRCWGRAENKDSDIRAREQGISTRVAKIRERHGAVITKRDKGTE
ncbi:hypothetical protein B0H13DRAFT_1904608 [Mycena leptocephala]|nr:hypothetical protein B0H13DRAFT_1904608 [Mycena leptocephala]